MRAVSEDRRVRRTRGLLQDALLTVMARKGYDAVTVQDIIDEADVGRSTFYAHFLDKDDLLLSGLDELRAFLSEQQRAAHAGTRNPEEQLLGFSMPFLRHVQEYKKLKAALAGEKGSHVAFKQMQVFLAGLVRDDLALLSRHPGATPAQAEAVVQCTVGALQALIGWWLDSDTPCSAEEVDRLFRQLAVPGIMAVLGPR